MWRYILQHYLFSYLLEKVDLMEITCENEFNLHQIAQKERKICDEKENLRNN